MRRSQRRLPDGWTVKLRELEVRTPLLFRNKAGLRVVESAAAAAASAPRPFPGGDKECVPVSFPLRFGVGCGVGEGDSHGLVLRLANLKIGADLDGNGERGARRRSRGKAAKAAAVADAAGVLLLAQAFCGPAAGIAMVCLAVVGMAQTVLTMVVNGSRGRGGGRGALCGRAEEFSAAAGVLSIAIPLLKWRKPELYWKARCVGAAIPLAAGYARTAVEVRNAPPGAGEAKWRLRHRWAAKRVCHLLDDLQEPSALGWVREVAEAGSRVTVRGAWVATARPGDRSWLTFSIPLPLARVLRRRERGGLAEEKQIIVTVEGKAGTAFLDGEPPAEFERYHYLAQLEDEEERSVEGFGGRAGVRSESYLSELGVRPGGWKGWEQRVSLFLRACWLVVVFLPLLLLAPLVYFLSEIFVGAWKVRIRRLVWWMVRVCLERGGAAFIKWGQWSATREDLFPEDLCVELGRLHDRAPEHSYRETRHVVQRYLGRPIEEIFEEFPCKPCASGSIAQVYKAKLRNAKDGSAADVAVKVRHPAVGIRIHQDFQIMSWMADLAQRLPALRWLNLRQSVEQFSHTLTAQADLRVEAENLEQFNKRFSELRASVAWPKLVPGLVSEGVIVESFERGQPLHVFLGHRGRSMLNTQIAAIGVDTYLKMMLVDNFVHTDLHPGNILARIADDGRAQERLQLVLLDCGLAEKLPPRVRYHFISFIIMIGAGDGERAAHHLLRFSWPYEQRCKDPQLLTEDMKNLFAADCNLRERPIDLNDVLKKVLQLCQKHQVTIDSSYATLVVGVCVLVAFARSLDPDMSIMDAAVPCLFLYNLTGQIMGRIYG